MDEDFFEKDQYSIENIQLLIDNRAEESIRLEFKAAGALANTNGNKDELAKDVSAMANSAGGVIIYGVAEEEHVASELSFVDGNNFTKEWIEQVINSRINRRISDLRVIPIRNEENIEESIYLIKIPESTNAPHMASGRYYKRFNFQAVKMEEYEVRQAYNRSQKTELAIENILVRPEGGGSMAGRIRNKNFNLGFQVRNIGRTIEQQYKLEIKLPHLLYLNYARPSALADYIIRIEAPWIIFSVPNTSPLFQEELTTVISSGIGLDQASYRSLPNENLILKLFYTNGVVERSFDLRDFLEIDGTPIRDVVWTS